MLRDLSPEPFGFDGEVLVFLGLNTMGGFFDIFEFLFGEAVDFLFELLHEIVDVASQLVGGFHVGLHQDGQTENTAVVVWEAHYDIAELLFCSEVVECWLLYVVQAEVLEQFCVDA